MITIRQIEAFKAVMDAGSVNQAARIMRLSQPAVSRLLSDLEANVGYSLFERRKGKLAARREAQALYAEVERSFVGLERIAETAERIGQERKTTLRLAVPPAFSLGPMPAIIARLVKAHPGLFISVETRSRSRILEGLADGHYDIGLASLPIETPGVGMAPLLSSEVACLVPADHPLSRRKVITPRDLGGVSLILGTERTPMRLELARLLGEAGIGFEQRIEVTTLQMACALIAQGVGAAFFVRWFFADGPLQGVRLIPFRPRLCVDFSVLFPAGRPPEGIAAEFVQACRAVPQESQSGFGLHGRGDPDETDAALVV